MEQVIGLGILAVLVLYLGNQSKTGFIQWLVIGLLGYMCYLTAEQNKVASIILLGSILTILFMKDRKKKGRPLFDFRLPRIGQSKPVENHRADLRPFLNDLTEWEREGHRERSEELRGAKSTISQMEKELLELRQENEILREQREQARKIEEATPRLKHYRKIVERRINKEDGDLSKLKEKRLKEELQRQREENRELKKK